MKTNSPIKLTAIDNSAPEPGDSEGAPRATGESSGSGGNRLSSAVVPDPDAPTPNLRPRNWIS